jgi:hypothetical protein|tara:strand:+ start:349 stop:549 length:201 start_codon:yes stop_codon:yes gene_type:complete
LFHQEQKEILRTEKKDSAMKKKNKVSVRKRFLDFIKKEWNSFLYWLMFKNYACSKCKGDDKKCNCK